VLATGKMDAVVNKPAEWRFGRDRWRARAPVPPDRSGGRDSRLPSLDLPSSTSIASSGGRCAWTCDRPRMIWPPPH